MSQPLGGSMSELMELGNQLADGWIEHAQRNHANTPELVAMMLIYLQGNIAPTAQLNQMVLLAATAVQRLTVQGIDFGPESGDDNR